MSPTQPGFVVIQEAPEGSITPLRKDETVRLTCLAGRRLSHRFLSFKGGTLPFFFLKEPIDHVG